MTEAKDFRTFIRIYSLFKSERLSANLELTLHKPLTRSVMTYACPAWEFATDTSLLKLQCLQNEVLRPTGNIPRYTLVHDLLDFKPSTCIQLYNKIMQATGRGHAKS
jgi:hypothetical protein